MKIYLWGLGKGCEKAMHNLKNDNIEILGFIDNNPVLQGKEYRGRTIYSIEQIEENYDFIVVTVIKYEAILFQLERIAVNMEKVVCYYDMEHCCTGKGNLFREEFWKIDLLEQRIGDLEKKLSIRINNLEYEIADTPAKRKHKLPIVREGKEAIEQIVNDKKSLIRFGDGEFEIMAGKERPIFQKYHDTLAERMKEVIRTTDERILIAIANNYGNLDIYTEEVADAIREYMTEQVRSYHNSVLQEDRIYYDAYMFKSYFPYKDKNGTADRVAQVKRIWEHREVVLVEGNQTRTGYGNDLLANADMVQRIVCPTKDAFDYYDAIFAEVRKLDKNKLILLVLGPAAKVLAYDLVQEGYQVVDIGQIDMDYEWYLAGKGIRVPIPNKYVSQLPPTNVPELEDADYCREIIAQIGV